VPKKTFHAFKAFRLLLDTPLRVAALGSDPGRLAVCAGISRDKSAASVLISHFRPAGDTLRLVVARPPWEGPVAYEVLVVNTDHDLRQVRAGRLPPAGLELTEILKAPSVGLIRLRKPAANE
jgi:hypothetical protein